jgi:ketosteroid isomerase-like protein
MQRSPEMESVLREFYDGMKRGDAGAVGDLVAAGDEVLCIGTDPVEWWEGHDKTVQVWKEQMDAMGGGIELVGGNPRAYESGDVGWFQDRPSFLLPGGSEVPTRLTGVATRQGGRWKLVQVHISIGIANEEAVGRELPT